MPPWRTSPHPYESLRATAAWSVGHGNPTVVLSDRSVSAFRAGGTPGIRHEVRGEIGAYLAADHVELEPGARHEWYTVADTMLDHARLIELRGLLAAPDALRDELRAAVAADRNELRSLIAAADGLQQTADEAATVHHFGSVLFNCFRGGTLLDSYRFPRRDLDRFVAAQNAPLHSRVKDWLASLPETLDLAGLRSAAESTGDAQLIRICGAYLPLMYSRRHGDPSRPWNRFSIRLQDESGEPIYGYEGNWRDIFQNWETLGTELPRLPGADGRRLPQRLDRRRIQRLPRQPRRRNRLGGRGPHRPVEPHRLLGRPPDHLPAPAAGEPGEVPPRRTRRRG